jgi:hypothetical protein
MIVGGRAYISNGVTWYTKESPVTKSSQQEKGREIQEKMRRE